MRQRPPHVLVFQSGAVCVMGMDGANMGPGLGSIYQDRTTAIAHLILFYFQYPRTHSIHKSPFVTHKIFTCGLKHYLYFISIPAEKKEFFILK